MQEVVTCYGCGQMTTKDLARLADWTFSIHNGRAWCTSHDIQFRPVASNGGRARASVR